MPLIDAAYEIGTWAGFRSPWADDDALAIAHATVDQMLQHLEDREHHDFPNYREFVAWKILDALASAGLVIGKVEDITS